MNWLVSILFSMFFFAVLSQHTNSNYKQSILNKTLHVEITKTICEDIELNKFIEEWDEDENEEKQHNNTFSYINSNYISCFSNRFQLNQLPNSLISIKYTHSSYTNKRYLTIRNLRI